MNRITDKIEIIIVSIIIFIKMEDLVKKCREQLWSFPDVTDTIYIEKVICYLKKCIIENDVPMLQKIIQLLKNCYSDLLQYIFLDKEHFNFLKVNIENEIMNIMFHQDSLEYFGCIKHLSGNNFKEFNFFNLLINKYHDTFHLGKYSCYIGGRLYEMEIVDELIFLYQFYENENFTERKKFLEYFEEVCRTTDFSDEYKIDKKK